MSNQRTFPTNPPHRTINETLKQRFKTNDIDSYCRWHPLKCYTERKQWEESGLITTWIEKDDDKCTVKRAVVRGDGKILSSVDKKQIECNMCIFFAKEENGILKGVDSLGLYKYE